MESVLVNGGINFIGSYTVDRFVNKDYAVTVLDNLERQVHSRKISCYKTSDANYIMGDILYRKHWLKAPRSVDYIIYHTGTMGMEKGLWQPGKYLSTNALTSARLYEVLEQKRRIRYRIKQKVVVSSKSIKGEGTFKCIFYGEIFPCRRYIERHKNHKWKHFSQQCNLLLHAGPLRENNPLQNPNPYSLGKYPQEDIALQYSKLLNIPTVAFRYFNVYGPRQSLNYHCTGSLAISLLWFKNGNPSILFDDGVQLIVYIYVEDVTSANALKNGSGYYNLGSRKPALIVDTIAYHNRSHGTNIEPVILEEFIIGNNRYDHATMEKCLMVFDATQFFNLENEIKRLIDWSSRENPRNNASKLECNLLKCLRQSR